MNMLYFVPLLLVVSAVTARDLYPNFHLNRDCLYQCLICVETWGSDLYNGAACAFNCERSLGQDMDKDCSRGNGGKRFTAQEELCLESCKKCVMGKDGDKGRMPKCYSTCLVTGIHKVAC